MCALAILYTSIRIVMRIHGTCHLHRCNNFEIITTDRKINENRKLSLTKKSYFFYINTTPFAYTRNYIHILLTRPIYNMAKYFYVFFSFSIYTYSTYWLRNKRSKFTRASISREKLNTKSRDEEKHRSFRLLSKQVDFSNIKCIHILKTR